jgi:hypothetical protein
MSYPSHHTHLCSCLLLHHLLLSPSIPPHSPLSQTSPVYCLHHLTLKHHQMYRLQFLQSSPHALSSMTTLTLYLPYKASYHIIIVTDDAVSLPNASGTGMQCTSSTTVDISVQCHLTGKPFSVTSICDDKDAIHFYTGLPDYPTFLACFKFLGSSVNCLRHWYGGKRMPKHNKCTSRALTPINEFFLVMCRLRLGLLEQDLAYRFQVSQSTCSVKGMHNMDKLSSCEVQRSSPVANKRACK